MWPLFLTPKTSPITQEKSSCSWKIKTLKSIVWWNGRLMFSGEGLCGFTVFVQWMPQESACLYNLMPVIPCLIIPEQGQECHSDARKQGFKTTLSLSEWDTLGRTFKRTQILNEYLRLVFQKISKDIKIFIINVYQFNLFIYFWPSVFYLI